MQLAGHRGPRVASMVGDDLMVRALTLSYRDTLIAFVSCDLIWLPRRIVCRIRNRVSRTSAIRPENLLVACTHTHSGPDTLDWYAFAPPIPDWWLEWLVNIISSTVYQAMQNLVVVDVTYGSAKFGLAVNRRRIEKNTVYREPFLPGLVDDCVSTLTFSADGRIIAAIVHASMHPVVLGAESNLISGDWCGEMVRILSRSLGGGWMFFNGCAGDSNPLVWTGRSYEEMLQVGAAAAARAAEAKENATPICVDTLWGRSISAKFSYKQHPYLSQEQERRIAENSGLLAEIQIIKLGPLRFLGLGGECLYEAGRFITDGIEKLLLINYANDYLGYIPTAKQYDEGGYEPASTMLSRRGSAAYLKYARNVLRI